MQNKCGLDYCYSGRLLQNWVEVHRIVANRIKGKGELRGVDGLFGEGSGTILSLCEGREVDSSRGSEEKRGLEK